MSTYVPEPPIDLREPAPQPDEDATLGELLGELGRDVTELMSTQFELAVVEVKEEARRAARAGSLLGAGSLVAYLAVTLGAFALAFGLAEGMELWLAFLVVAVLLGAVGAALFLAGKAQLDATDPVPHKTIETLEEDARWLRQQIS
jgi:uncharacterized membrane protein YqjE